MNKTNYHYIHFPQSLLADVNERKELALMDIKETYGNQTKAMKGITNCSIKMSMLDEFINNKKNEKEWYLLLCFLAIKSILGKKQFIKTNYKHILSRMLGLASYKDLINTNLSEYQNKLIDQYTRNNQIAEDKMKRLIDKLRANWHITHYARFTRGFYISIEGRKSEEELMFICEDQRETNKIKELNMRSRNAYLNYKAPINPSIKSTEFE
jgi:hypothetical protein